MGLRNGVLTRWETLGQSIAGIAPSATPGMLIPIVFGFAGNGTWLSYLLATIGIVFTAQCINVFTRRSASPGSLYTFVTEGLGVRAGTATGWALLFAYVFCTAACIVEFALYACSLSDFFLHVNVTPPLMIALGAAVIAYIGYKNIKMSAVLMLRLEFASIGLILLITALVFWRHGLTIDMSQLTLQGVTFENVRKGLVIAIFGFVAFESSASLGTEADQPLQSIPNAIMRSVLFSGAFFVVTSYAMVLCFHGADPPLDKCSTPLMAMSAMIAFPELGPVTDFGIMISFFAAGLANLNAAARAVFQMSQDGHFPEWFGRTHHINCTPHTAVLVCSGTSMCIAVALTLAGAPLMDSVGWLGTLATFGMIYGYMATSIAAGFMLKKTGELKFFGMLIVCASLVVLVSALVGSIFPVPDNAYKFLPWLFLIYMIGGWLGFRRLPPDLVPRPLVNAEQLND